MLFCEAARVTRGAWPHVGGEGWEGWHLGEEDVLSLEVAMQNLSVVDVLEAETDLHKPVENLPLGQQAAAPGLYDRGEVACPLAAPSASGHTTSSAWAHLAQRTP